MLATWDSIPTASVTIDNLMIQHHKEMYVDNKMQATKG
jgi:hypothetical protein